METNVEMSQQMPILSVAGEIDHFVAPKLQRQIEDLIDSGHHRLVLDFQELNFLDSGGIGVLFSMMQQLIPHEGKIAIVCDNDNVVRILELVGLFSKHTNLLLFEDQDQALSALLES